MNANTQRGTMPGSSPRNGMPVPVGYVYRGTGEDVLTPPAAMAEWNRRLREQGATPYPRSREEAARRAEVETGLAREASCG